MQQHHRTSHAPPATIEVFADGACTHNGTRRARGAFAVFVEDGHPENTARVVPSLRGAPVTNQVAELLGCIAAAEAARRMRGLAVSRGAAPPHVVLYTDSMYAVKCVTRWAAAWDLNGWKTHGNRPVKHAVLIKRLRALLSECGAQIAHVRAHQPRPPPDAPPRAARAWYGNMRADQMAAGALEAA